MALQVPQAPFRIIEPYELLEKIGVGGMGAVYKGRHRQTGQLVAIKMIMPEKAANPVAIERFKQESRVARGLDHPHIVRGLDFGVDGTDLYMVMEFVDGQSLGELLEKKGRLPEDQAVRILTQVAEGLQLAHDYKIIHRDIKPDNIMLTADGLAKITDLGLAKNHAADLDLTRPLSGLGTPNFMAPEQFGDAKHADVRCDIYSLGATLYQAVTGELPFKAKSNLNILKKKLKNELASPRDLVPTLSEALDFAIRQAVRADPQQRFASCREFAAALTGKKDQTKQTDPTLPAADIGPRSEIGKLPSSEERRIAVRYAANLDSSCQPAGRIKEQVWAGKVQDISATGLSLMLRRRFEPGTGLILELKPKAQEMSLTSFVRVLWVKETSRKKWLIGCSFEKSLSTCELRAFI